MRMTQRMLNINDRAEEVMDEKCLAMYERRLADVPTNQRTQMHVLHLATVSDDRAIELWPGLTNDEMLTLIKFAEIGVREFSLRGLNATEPTDARH
jgi:hypothetical protein